MVFVRVDQIEEKKGYGSRRPFSFVNSKQRFELSPFKDACFDLDVLLHRKGSWGFQKP